MLPCLRAGEVRDLQLAIRKSLHLIVPHRLGANSCHAALLFCAALRLGSRLTSVDRVRESCSGCLDSTITMLAQGFERVLRIPRHFVGERVGGGGWSV
jgi:hypothetical protein